MRPKKPLPKPAPLLPLPPNTADTTGRTAAGDTTSLAAQLAKKTKDAAADSAATSTQGGVLAKLFTMPGRLGVNLRDTARMNHVLRSPEAKAILPPTLALLWNLKPTTIDKQEYLELVPVRKTRDGVPPLSGEVVSDARADIGQNGQPEV